MTNESLSATVTIKAAAETVFAIIADPTSHAAIDGTGWVREPLDANNQLTAAGQIFQMAMYHNNHPDGSYQTANKVVVFDPPSAIAWKTGTADLEFGEWIWRYDLTPISQSETEVKLSYDWSAVPAFRREYIQFPPFAPDHLHNSLNHLAELVPSIA
ncbi:MAG: SRPBCC family protein [Actinomycetota bacterium]|nr:SRPBCC family protein [Actinomycetota bacterium]